MDLTTAPEMSKYEYTYKVVSIAFESATMLVEYTPVDVKYTTITYNLPILATFDINNVKAYVDQFAPHEKWYAQDMILQHGDTLLGLNK